MDVFFEILFILVFLDIVLLKVMFKLYFSIGIPIFKKKLRINKNKTIQDIAVYLGTSEGYAYKIVRNQLIFRTKFTFSNMYRGLRFMSIIKGDIVIRNDIAYITQRLNLSTLYMYLLFIYLDIFNRIDVLGYVLLGVVIIFNILYIIDANSRMQTICITIKTYINAEKTKSCWGD